MPPSHSTRLLLKALPLSALVGRPEEQGTLVWSIADLLCHLQGCKTPSQVPNLSSFTVQKENYTL